VTRPTRQTRRHRRAPSVRATLVFGLTLAACGSPPLDDPRSEGGTAFDPRGVLAGTIQYGGPRVPCVADADTEEPTVAGRVVLTLFRDDAPPPPEGTAQAPLNLLAVPGAELFRTPEDCLDPAASPEIRREVIVRSAPFVWPEIPLGQGGPVAYQVRGFFDADADFVPFFPERNQPTGGDHAGGAVGPDGAFTAIPFGAAEDHPDGQRIDGVAVNLGAVVWTERPAFRVTGSSGHLGSGTVLPFVLDPEQGPVLDEPALFDAARFVLRMPTLSDPDDEAVLGRAEELGIAFGAGTPAHAWFLREVDLDGDGAQDPHPVLPGLGWTTPILTFTRVRSDAEVAARVPPVTLLGSVRPGLPGSGKRVAFPALEVLVAPVGLVDLVSGRPECRVPYVPPGNFRETYEGEPRVCQELPTGRYVVTALQGVAGGEGFVPVPSPDVSDTGFDLVGGTLPTQSWSSPSALDPRDPGDWPHRLHPGARGLLHRGRGGPLRDPAMRDCGSHGAGAGGSRRAGRGGRCLYPLPASPVVLPGRAAALSPEPQPSVDAPRRQPHL